jgi:hypothetical protein
LEPFRWFLFQSHLGNPGQERWEDKNRRKSGKKADRITLIIRGSGRFLAVVYACTRQYGCLPVGVVLTGFIWEISVYIMPQCTPTRVCFLTGQYPYRNGWVNHWDGNVWGIGYFDFDAKYYPTAGKIMQSAGYKTAFAGKWQIDDFNVHPDAMTKAGFDEYHMHSVATSEEAKRIPNPA